MTKKATKDSERFYLDEFLIREHRFHLVDANRERPDFMLADATGNIGMEITQLHRDDAEHGSQARRDEENRDTFLRAAAKRYYQRGGLPIRVQAIQLDRTDLNLDDFADRLQRARPARDMEMADFEMTPGDDPDDLPFAKFNVRALPSSLPAYSWWVAVQNNVGWRGALDVQTVQTRIDEKATKLLEYRKAATRCALLLYANATRNSGLLRWPPDAATLDARGFDEVYLYVHPELVHRLA